MNPGSSPNVGPGAHRRGGWPRTCVQDHVVDQRRKRRGDLVVVVAALGWPWWVLTKALNDDVALSSLENEIQGLLALVFVKEILGHFLWFHDLLIIYIP